MEKLTNYLLKIQEITDVKTQKNYIHPYFTKKQAKIIQKHLKSRKKWMFFIKNSIYIKI